MNWNTCASHLSPVAEVLNSLLLVLAILSFFLFMNFIREDGLQLEMIFPRILHVGGHATMFGTMEWNLMWCVEFQWHVLTNRMCPGLPFPPFPQPGNGNKSSSGWTHNQNHMGGGSIIRPASLDPESMAFSLPHNAYLALCCHLFRGFFVTAS